MVKPCLKKLIIEAGTQNFPATLTFVEWLQLVEFLEKKITVNDTQYTTTNVVVTGCCESFVIWILPDCNVFTVDMYFQIKMWRCFKSVASNRFSITFNTDATSICPMMGSGTAFIAFESISANGVFFKLLMRLTESRS